MVRFNILYLFFLMLSYTQAQAVTLTVSKAFELATDLHNQKAIANISRETVSISGNILVFGKILYYDLILFCFESLEGTRFVDKIVINIK